MKHNDSTELSGYSFPEIYNKDGSTNPPRPQIRIFPEFLSEISTFSDKSEPKVDIMDVHAPIFRKCRRTEFQKQSCHL